MRRRDRRAARREKKRAEDMRAFAAASATPKPEAARPLEVITTDDAPRVDEFLPKGRAELLRTLTDASSLSALGRHYGADVPEAVYVEIAEATEAILLRAFGLSVSPPLDAPSPVVEPPPPSPLEASDAPSTVTPPAPVADG